MKNQVHIRPLINEDIVVASEAFNQIGWHKPISLFEGYMKEQELGERLIWVAFNRHCERSEAIHENSTGSPRLSPRDDGIRNDLKGEFAGYVTLKWCSLYPSFKAQNIPEIMDLNVLPHYRKMGIGSKLLDLS